VSRTRKAIKEDITLRNGLDAYTSVSCTASQRHGSTTFVFADPVSEDGRCHVWLPYARHIPHPDPGRRSAGFGKYVYSSLNDRLCTHSMPFSINRNQQSRYWAQLVVAFVFTTFVLGYIHWEFHLRQGVLSSHSYNYLSSYSAHIRTIPITHYHSNLRMSRIYAPCSLLYLMVYKESGFAELKAAF
jgi:hypothetical protein